LAPVIRHHHEWYDGTGYPDGLKGQEIPLGSRIICIADAYCTMVTRRVYRSTMSQNEALIELERCSGTQFDPGIIKVVSTALPQQIATDD
ncbi:MAG TPA: HD domain-containing phosphohydrolase, partial [Dehalococcoidales bacterium]